MFLSFCLALCFFAQTGFTQNCTDDDTLRTLFVIVRHGDRTPAEAYPNDPYKGKSTFPYGIETLTNIGAERQYEVGKFIRKNYDHFLGFTYYDGVLVARPTNLKRHIASTLAILAGIYPPKAINVWSKKYKIAKYWQPIPIEVKPVDLDRELQGTRCARFQKLYREYKETDEYKALENKHRKLIEFLREKMGIPDFSTLEDVKNAFNNFDAQFEMNLKLPSWLDDVFPTKFFEPIADYYASITATTELKKYIAGYLIKEVTTEARKKIAGELPGRKLYLYNASEFVLIAVKIILGIFDGFPPQFNAVLWAELHEIENKFFVKFLYQNYLQTDPRVLTLPGCNEVCPTEKLLQIVESVIPTDDDSCDVDKTEM